MYGTIGKMANARKHVEVVKELTQGIEKWKHLMAEKNVLGPQTLPRAATLKNVRVKKKMHNRIFAIWY